MLSLRLRRPARYINHEFNAVKKEGGNLLLFTLCYPDLYEVGTSNIGIQILYHVLNAVPYVRCERVFLPYPDLEELLKKEGLPLTTLESGTPVKKSDVLGISVQHELTYTNILTILHLSGIPIKKNERGDKDPIVIAGGPCTSNPQPLMPFFDALFIGEGEEAVVEMADILRRAKEEGARRDEVIEELSRVEGVLVEGKKAKRRIVKDLESVPFPTNPIVPLTQSVQGRATVEIARGCVNGCRFCQAGFIYRPFRIRSPERILSLCRETLNSTGYDELSLLSLSTSDYPYLEELLEGVSDILKEKKVLLSLPSVRVGSVTEAFVKVFGRSKKPTITLAPESGSERILRIINKGIDLNLLFRDVEILFKNGWRRIKLYFLVGVPGETESDILETAKLLKDLAKLSKKRNSIHASFSIFTPKPFTPFELAPQDGVHELEEKLKLLKDKLKRLRISFSLPDPLRTKVEAVLSRGGRDTPGIILDAWKMGARLDGWDEHFRKDIWLDLLPLEEMDRLTESPDPTWWDLVDPQLRRDFLEREWKLSKDGATTPSCLDACTGCGACKIKMKKISFSPRKGDRKTKKDHKQEEREAPPFEVTLYYSKLHTARYLSHLDLYNTVLRLLRMSGLPIWYSKGFHPNPAISFHMAYPLGVELLSEPFKVKLQKPISPEDIEKLNDLIPRGLGLEISAERKTTSFPLSPGFDNYLIISETELEGFTKIEDKHIPDGIGLEECDFVYLLRLESGKTVTSVVGKDWYKKIRRIVKI